MFRFVKVFKISSIGAGFHIEFKSDWVIWNCQVNLADAVVAAASVEKGIRIF